MNTLLLFTDGSVDNQSKMGYGAYLAIEPSQLESSIDSLKKAVKTKRFENTSSTKLELQAALWAFDELKPFKGKLLFYSDSQNITTLPKRRKRMESADYQSKNNKPLKLKALYQEFFRMTDQLDIELNTIQGHKPSKAKDSIDLLFSLVDKASRHAQRNDASSRELKGAFYE